MYIQGEDRMRRKTIATGIIACLFSLLMILVSCTGPLSHNTDAASTLVIRISDGDNEETGGDAVGASSVSASEHFQNISDLSLRIIVADEGLLTGSSGGIRSRVRDVSAGTANGSGPSPVSLRYNEVFISSGGTSVVRADMGQFTAGRRYLLLVVAEGIDAENQQRAAYGFTRLTTLSGENRVSISMTEDKSALRQALQNWYGIIVPLDGLNVTIDFSNPSQPVINFSGQNAVLIRDLAETMNVTATGGFMTYEWFLNGTLSGNDPAWTVNSVSLSFGTHNVTLVVTDQNGLPYTAGFSFSVVGN
jgi:hypothetical protein